MTYRHMCLYCFHGTVIYVEDAMAQYRVTMHSKPGMWAGYDGHVDVFADEDDEAVDKALNKLKRTSFPDRGRSDWIIDDIARVGD